jgi:hypothetical protein
MAPRTTRTTPSPPRIVRLGFLAGDRRSRWWRLVGKLLQQPSVYLEHVCLDDGRDDLGDGDIRSDARRAESHDGLMHFFGPRNPLIGVDRQLFKAACTSQHCGGREVVDAPSAATQATSCARS